MRPDGDGVAGGGGERRAEGTGNSEGGGAAQDNSDSDEEEEHFDISLAASHSVSTNNSVLLPQYFKNRQLSHYWQLFNPFYKHDTNFNFKAMLVKVHGNLMINKLFIFYRF